MLPHRLKPVMIIITANVASKEQSVSSYNNDTEIHSEVRWRRWPVKVILQAHSRPVCRSLVMAVHVAVKLLTFCSASLTAQWLPTIFAGHSSHRIDWTLSFVVHSNPNKYPFDCPTNVCEKLLIYSLAKCKVQYIFKIYILAKNRKYTYKRSLHWCATHCLWTPRNRNAHLIRAGRWNSFHRPARNCRCLIYRR